MTLLTAHPDTHRRANPAHFSARAIILILAISSWRFAPYVRADDRGADAQIYLSQAGPVLADADDNLSNLEYYLPLASVHDPNDPTWSLAQQASDATAEDAGILRTLSAPDELEALNDALIASLSAAGGEGDAAIAALSGGDTATGLADLEALRSSIRDFKALVTALSAPSPANQAP